MTNKSTPRFYEFGAFRLDAYKRVLLRDGEQVLLAAKTVDTLLALVERRHQVLEKDELLRLLWPETIVEEGNLTVNISVLRKALGESPSERRYILTVPGRGYRLIAPVREVGEEETHLNYCAAHPLTHHHRDGRRGAGRCRQVNRRPAVQAPGGGQPW